MKCPGCNAETHRFLAMTIGGKDTFACSECDEKAPKVLRIAVRRKSNRITRKFEKYEVPREVRIATKKLMPKVKAADTPKIRDLASVNPAKKRARVFEMGDTAKSSRNARVLTKLTNQLGPNPKILSDDGFEVLAESTCL